MSANSPPPRNGAGDSGEGSSVSCDPATEEERKLRVTLVEVLINTNISGGRNTVSLLRSYLETHLFTRRGFEQSIPLLSDNPKLHILKVEVIAPAIEEGPQRHFIHAHFMLRITHADKVLLGDMARKMKKHVIHHSIFRPFVSVKLLNGAPENYALKEKYFKC